jgi:hypothetical protein
MERLGVDEALVTGFSHVRAAAPMTSVRRHRLTE